MTTNDPQKQNPEEEYVHEDDSIIGTAFKWSLVAIALIAVIGAGIWFATREKEVAEQTIERDEIEAPDRLVQTAADRPDVRFTDITAAAGITFEHVSGATGEKLLPETMGGGSAFFDYDGDGDQDLLFVNSTHWAHDNVSSKPTMALYRNDGSGNFSDVTRGSGLDVSFYGQGAAVADYDGDGDTDVFLTAVGPNRLFRNDGGTFKDVTRSAGVAGESERWSSSAGFFDYDNDGDLDLFVCNYVQWSREIDIELDFSLNGTDRAYGPPTNYQGTHSYLYRNDGGGKFTDVSAEAGIEVANPATGAAMGKALALTFADVDDDGFLDIFVANDTVQNVAFQNKGDGTFKEIGSVSGLGFDSTGSATGAMGIDVADFANGDYLGVGIGNFSNETTSFYVQQPRNPWQWVDQANAEGIGSPSRLKLSFGLFFFDYDLDGRQDLLQANGHLEDEINEVQPSQHYLQPAQVFWNCGPKAKSCFAAVDEKELGDLSRPIVGRGAGYADIDADGDLDVLLTQTGGKPLLIRNEQDLGNHWLRVKAVGSGNNTDAIGAEVILVAGGETQRRFVMPSRSYLSQVELPVTFGLGKNDGVESLVVRWPDGSEQTVSVDDVDTTITVRQGELVSEAEAAR